MSSYSRSLSQSHSHSHSVSEEAPFRRISSPAKSFRRDFKAFKKFKKESSTEKSDEKKQELLTKYLKYEDVKKHPDYVSLWMSVTESVIDPEEVFVFLYSEEIGSKSILLYRKWVEHYLTVKELILASQVTDLAESNLINNYPHDLKPRGKCLEVDELREFVEAQILARLVEDFYSKEFYKSNVACENSEDSGMFQDDEGISEEAFKLLQEKNIKGRIGSVLELVYGHKVKANPSKDKTKPLRSTFLRKARRKKFSDLVNTREFNGLSVYVQQEFRSMLPKARLLAYEYEYMSIRYKEKQPKKVSDQKTVKRPFWISVENFNKQEFLFKKKKILTLANENKEEVVRNPSKRRRAELHAIPDTISVKKQPQAVKNKTKVSKDQKDLFFAKQPLESTSTGLSFVTDFNIDSFVQSRLLGMFEDSHGTRVKLIKPKRLPDGPLNVLKELPRGREEEE